MKLFEAVMVPDNPLMSMAYPPRVLLEVSEDNQIDGILQVKAWFKEAQEQGQYAGCSLLSVRPIKE